MPPPAMRDEENPMNPEAMPWRCRSSWALLLLAALCLVPATALPFLLPMLFYFLWPSQRQIREANARARCLTGQQVPLSFSQRTS